jgi:hypothetical protein
VSIFALHPLRFSFWHHETITVVDGKVGRTFLKKRQSPMHPEAFDRDKARKFFGEICFYSTQQAEVPESLHIQKSQSMKESCDESVISPFVAWGNPKLQMKNGSIERGRGRPGRW